MTSNRRRLTLCSLTLGGLVALAALWGPSPRALGGINAIDPDGNWLQNLYGGAFRIRKADEATSTDQTPRAGYEAFEDIQSGTIIYASAELNAMAAAPGPSRYQIVTHQTAAGSRVFRLATRTGESWEWIRKREWTRVLDPQPGKSATYQLHAIASKDAMYLVRINLQTGQTWNLEASAEGNTWVPFDDVNESR